MKIYTNRIPAYNKGNRKTWIASIPGVRQGFGDTKDEAVNDLLGIINKKGRCITNEEYSETSYKDGELYYENLFTYIEEIFISKDHYFIPHNLLDITDWDEEICVTIDYKMTEKYGIDFYKIGSMVYNDSKYDVFYSEYYKEYLK